MLAITAAALFGAPVFLAVAVTFDVVRTRLRLPTVRTYLFVLQYLINDSVEILFGPLYPLVPSLAERTAWWSVDLLRRRAEQLLGIEVDLDDESLATLSPEQGPLIVVARHVSVLDASLPGVVCRRFGLRARGVMMLELLNDPGFDIVYGRLGSVFIPRDDPEVALGRVRAMTSGAGPGDAFVIFPEGRLFSRGALESSMKRLGRSSPERAERLGGLRSTLPPRPGGMLALLESLPDADVVVLEHRGLDRYRRLLDIAADAPVGLRVAVTAERIPRATIPDGDAAVRWLDELWLQLDREASRVAHS